MSDPNSKDQPAYVWDMFYGPHTDKPVTANDRGGVHTNSSLLNRIAALLCLNYGMSLEEAVSYWMTVAMGMTPEADYVQLHALLKWAAKFSGNEQYLDAINALIDEERLDTTARPTDFPDGQRMAILRLPDTEAFEDDNWAMLVFQVDIPTLVGLGSELLSLIMQSSGDPDSLKKALEDIVNHIRLDENQLTVNDEPSENDFVDSVLSILKSKDIYRQIMTWPETDTREMPLVEGEGNLSLYLLLNINSGGSKISGGAVLLGGQWIDLANIDRSDMTQIGRLAMNIMKNAGAKQEGKIVYLPTEGLDQVLLSEEGMSLLSAA
jgi:hypothetical protein